MRVTIVAGMIVAVHVAVVGSVVFTQGCASTRPVAATVEPVATEPAPPPVLPPVAPVVLPPHTLSFPAIQPPATPEPVKATVDAGNVYVVKAGDSLSKIAAKHGVNARELAELNQIVDANKIRIGQKLAIPGEGKAGASKTDKAQAEKPAEKKAPEAPAAAPAMESPAAASAAPAAADVAPAADVPAVPAVSAEPMLNYTVQDGDTIETISRLFVVKQDDIRRVNNIPAGEDVKPNQRIQIPPTSSM